MEGCHDQGGIPQIWACPPGDRHTINLTLKTNKLINKVIIFNLDFEQIEVFGIVFSTLRTPTVSLQKVASIFGSEFNPSMYCYMEEPFVRNCQ